MRGIEQYLQVDAATLGALKYAGTWNASTNTPTLASGVGTQGQYYVVSVAGSTNLDGETNWQVGDWAVFNGSVWQKVDGGSTGLLSTLTVTGNTYLATTSGNVGIGTTSPASQFNMYNATNATATIQGDAIVTLAIERYSTNSIAPSFAIRKFRGTLAAPTAVATGDVIANLNFVAYGGTTQRVVSQVRSFVDTYVSDTDISSYLTFSTSPAGSAAATERMRIDSAGNLGLGATPSAWISAYRALDIGNTASVYGRTDSSIEAALVANAYRNSAGNWIYKLTGIAGRFGYDTIGSWAWFTAPSGTAGNAISFTQAMTLDASGNLLVGSTSGPYSAANRGYINISGSTDSVLGLSNGASARGYLQGTATAVTLGATTGSSITFDINGEKARLDASGNLGLGVTPKTWSTGSAIEVGNYFLKLSGSQTYGAVVLNNAYYDGGWKFAEANWANMYQTIGGVHSWHTSTMAGGAAGNAISFTQAMTLDASGRLLVGRTSSAGSAYSLELDNGTSDNRLGMYAGGTLTGGLLCSTNEIRLLALGASTVLTFQTNGSERMRIDASGRLLIGTTTAGIGNNNATALSVANGTATVYQSIRASGGEELYLYSAAGSVGLYSYTNHPLVLGTNNAERLRITSAGNIHTPAGATTMTNGFFYIPAAAGVPTGVPTAITGTVPMYYDTTNNKFYVYNGAWKSVTLT